MADGNGKSTRRNDIIAIVGLIAMALIVLLIVQMKREPVSQATADETSVSTPALYAVVQNTQGERDVLPLDEDTTLVVTCPSGTNTVTVSEGAVSIAEADCENQICVHTGAVSQTGDIIVCLPHQLVVQVTDDPDSIGPLGL